MLLQTCIEIMRRKKKHYLITAAQYDTNYHEHIVIYSFIAICFLLFNVHKIVLYL